MTDFIKLTGFYQFAAGFFSEGGWKMLLMIIIGAILLWLAIKKQFEPLLLVGIAMGVILTNLPGANLFHTDIWDAFTGGGEYVNAAGEVFSHVTFTTVMQEGGLLDIFYIGIKSVLFPCLIFIGVGAMVDFGPMISNPISLLLGAAAQVGIFLAYLGANLIGFTQQESASIGIIGGADGPTAIFTATMLAPHLLGAIAISAYAYMALVPVIQPPIMKLLTTKKERGIIMRELRTVSKMERILFPVCIAVLVSLLVPSAAPLVASLMFGNLLRECGVVERLSKAAQNELLNIVTLFLGLAVGASATAERFLNPQTLGIILMGVLAFAFGTAGGVLLAKFMNLFLKNKINPLIGSAGISAVPMAARVSQKLGQQENPGNFLLMHAMGPNVAGVIGSAIAAGVLISILG